MIYDLQKASMWKRISAWLFDMILLVILVVGVACLLSMALGYDGYVQRMNDCYTRVEEQYGVDLGISLEESEKMSEEEARKYQEAYDALNADPEAVYVFNMIIRLTLVIASLSMLLGFLILEFVVPLLFKNGQTLGKKIFGVAVMRTDGVKVSVLQMFVRTFLGKYTIETMIPVLILTMIFFGTIGVVGIAILGLILLLQVIMMIATSTNSAIHDKLAGTVTVDYASQMIFDSADAMIEYKKQVHAQMASRQDY